MTFFLSCEAYSSGATLLMRYHKLTEHQLSALDDCNYGHELTTISLITIMMPEDFFKDGGWKERTMFQKKSHSADLRLRLNYQEFLCATPDRRATIYCNHILKSFETLRKKVSCDYRINDLLHDVQTQLNDSVFLTELNTIRRFP